MSADQVARQHHEQRAALSRAAQQAAARQWASVSPNDVARSWLQQAPTLTAVVTQAQLQAALLADPYVASALAAQGLSPAAVAAVQAASFAGVASDGRQLASLLVQPALTMLAALSSGRTPTEASAAGLAALQMIVGTQVADAGRTADQVALVAQPVAEGYVRVLTLPSCSRCVLLAGKFYRWGEPFLRHPLCDCTSVPGNPDTVGDVRTDPMAYFESLTEAEQDRIFTKSGAEAIRDGADINQVVNARQGLYSAGGRKFTNVGMSRRSLYGGYEIDPETGRLTKRPRGRKPPPRLTTDQIYREANGDRDKAIRLLRRFGYLH